MTDTLQTSSGLPSLDFYSHNIDSWTIPGLLLARAESDPGGPAFYAKENGSYQKYSWADYLHSVKKVALGLDQIGLKQGDRVAILGDSNKEWLIAAMGSLVTGAVILGIYPTSASQEIRYLLADSGCSLSFVETHDHLDSILNVLGKEHQCKSIITFDKEAATGANNLNALITLDQLTEMGSQALSKQPERFNELLGRINPEDLGFLVYTSGTTKDPKGVMLTHKGFLAGTDGYTAVAPGLREESHRFIVHLPLGHVVSLALGLVMPLSSYLVPYFGENVAKFTETIKEVKPTFYVVPPRFYQKFAAQIIAEIQGSSWFRRSTYNLAMRVARKLVHRRWESKPIPLWMSWISQSCERMIFRPLVGRFGFDKLKYTITGSAPMPREVMTIWQTWGFDMREVYGQTELPISILAHRNPWPKPGTVGTPLTWPGYEVKVAEDGELLIKGPPVMLGYWNKPEETAATLKDGWVYTGDIVEWTPNGELKLIDRKKEIIKTAGGKSISPAQVENELKQSPYIGEAAVVGEGKKYLTALIEPDLPTVQKWAKNHGITINSYADLVQSEATSKLIEGEIATANSGLARVEQVKKFRILPVEMTPDQGVVTATRKKKRRQIDQVYRELIDSMYETSEEDLISGQVGLQ